MNRLSLIRRASIIGFLVEGMSLRAASRLADCSINTVNKLLHDVGTACTNFQDAALRNLPCKRFKVDEIWSFFGAQKNVAQGAVGYGDVWTWAAICADTKLIASWMVGSRDGDAARAFIADLADRLSSHVQITTDGHKVYLQAIEGAFGADIDYAMLIKLFGEGPSSPECKYSPASQLGTKIIKIEDTRDIAKILTSHVEYQNLTMRMSMSRFTRLANGVSKKVERHANALALHFMHYNFGLVHKALRVTPAMEAGVSDHVWSLEEIAALVAEPVATKRCAEQEAQL